MLPQQVERGRGVLLLVLWSCTAMLALATSNGKCKEVQRWLTDSIASGVICTHKHLQTCSLLVHTMYLAKKGIRWLALHILTCITHLSCVRLTAYCFLAVQLWMFLGSVNLSDFLSVRIWVLFWQHEFECFFGGANLSVFLAVWIWVSAFLAVRIWVFFWWCSWECVWLSSVHFDGFLYNVIAFGFFCGNQSHAYSC